MHRTLFTKSNLSMLTILSLIYLWPIKIPFGPTAFSLYIPLAIMTAMVIGLRKNDLHLGVILSVSILVLLMAQVQFGVRIVNPTRTYMGCVILVVMIIALRTILQYLVENHVSKIMMAIQLGIYLVAFKQLSQLGLWTLGSYQADYWHYFAAIPRVSAFFAEPSHLAIGMAPAIYIYLFNKDLAGLFSRRAKLEQILVLMIIALSPSATMFLVLGAAAGLRLVSTLKPKDRSFIISTIVVGSLFFVIIYGALSVANVSERILGLTNIMMNNGVIDVQTNKSSALFIKGYEMMTQGLQHYPLGTGLLNMELANPLSRVSHFNDIYFEANKNDGTSLLFKTITELGILGIGYVIYVIYYTLRTSRIKLDTHILMSAILLGYICSFARGTSYFDGLPMLAIALSFTLLKKQSFQDATGENADPENSEPGNDKQPSFVRPAGPSR